MHEDVKHVVITGASSGIGEALAKLYAKKGCTLSITGRDPARLQIVSDACAALGAANINAKILCVTDKEGMQTWLRKLDETLPVDIIIANAGIGAGTGESNEGENPEQVQHVFDVNLQGVLNTIHPLLPTMIQRSKGHIAIMSSLAGFRGWPGAPSYCASKAAVKTYGEGLRGAIASRGVKVHVICPGFVKSRMTDTNNFKMPFLMSAEKAAEIIDRGIQKNKGRIAFPAKTTFFAWLFSVMPDALAEFFLKKMPKKGAMQQ